MAARHLLSAIPAIGLLVASTAAVAALSAPADPSRPQALVFPPWWSQERAIVAAASAGELRGPGGLPFILIVQSRTPGAPRAAGAMLAFDAAALRWCGRSL